MRYSIFASILGGLAFIGCGDDGGTGGSGGSGGATTTSGTTTSGTTTSGTTTSSTTSTMSTGTSSTTSTTNSTSTGMTASTTTGGGSTSCMDLCTDLVAVVAQVQGCQYTQMECEQDCTGGLANLPQMCQDEFFVFADCAVADGPDAWSCAGGGPGYDGMACDAEVSALQMCLM